MKKFNYERPQVNIVDYELDRNIAENDAISAEGKNVLIDVEGKGLSFFP